ncbi:MAG: flagellar assembly protein T N-terminal domain-containing protein [Pseudomonadota bacterium]
MKTIFFILIAIYSTFSAAESNWIYGQGLAQISNSNLESARKKAIENAIADASYTAGAVIVAEDLLSNGILSESSFKVSSKSDIKDLEVLNESVKGDILSVNIRVKIRERNDCKGNEHKTKILVTNFEISDPRQASVGKVHSIGYHITNRISDQLNARSSYAFSSTENFSLNEKFPTFRINKSQIINHSDLIARKFDSQYVVFGIIRDLSLLNIEERSLIRSKKKNLRNFTLSILVVDVFRSLVIIDKSYHFESEWSFDLFQTVDLNASVFWQSEYGRSLIDSLLVVVDEINTAIACQPVFSQIVDRIDDDYFINSGKNHNIRVGKKLPLYKKKVLPSGSAFLRKIEGASLTVVSTGENTTLLLAEDGSIAISTSLYDLVQLE